MPIIEQTRFEVLPAGEYTATIADVQITAGKFGDQAEFSFVIEDGEFAGAVLKGWTSARFSPKSRLYAWAKAAFGGQPIPPTYNLDTDDLLQRRVNLMVIARVKESGEEFSKIDDCRPYRVVPRGRAGAAPGAAPAAPGGNGGPAAPGAAPGGPGAVPGGNGGPVAGVAPAAASGGPGAAPAASGGFPPDNPDDIPF